MECSEAMECSVPNEIVQEAYAININDLIPKSSKKVYELLYNKLSEWKTERNRSDDLLLVQYTYLKS